MGTYLWNVLIAIDQLFNALTGGDPDETVSSRMGRWSQLGGWRAIVAKPICWLTSLFDKDHCPEAIEADEGQKDLFG
jgi:hypothetical protein